MKDSTPPGRKEKKRKRLHYMTGEKKTGASQPRSGGRDAMRDSGRRGEGKRTGTQVGGAQNSEDILRI